MASGDRFVLASRADGGTLVCKSGTPHRQRIDAKTGKIPDRFSVSEKAGAGDEETLEKKF
jgi:hypothetical protein